VWGVSTVSWAARLASEQAPGPSAFSPRRQVPCVGSRAAVPPPQWGHHWGRDPGSGPLGDDGLLPCVVRVAVKCAGRLLLLAGGTCSTAAPRLGPAVRPGGGCAQLPPAPGLPEGTG